MGDMNLQFKIFLPIFPYFWSCLSPTCGVGFWAHFTGFGANLQDLKAKIRLPIVPMRCCHLNVGMTCRKVICVGSWWFLSMCPQKSPLKVGYKSQRKKAIFVVSISAFPAPCSGVIQCQLPISGGIFKMQIDGQF